MKKAGMKFMPAILLVSGLLGIISCTQQANSQSEREIFDTEVKDKEILIRGEIVGASKEEIADSITIYADHQYIVPIVNGKFEVQFPRKYHGRLANLSYSKQFPEDSDRKTYMIPKRFVAEDSVFIRVDVNAKQVDIKGGRHTQAYNLYYAEKESFTERKDELRDKKKEGAIDAETYSKEMTLLDDELKNWRMKYVTDHPYSWYSFFVLESLVKKNLGIPWTDEPKGQSELQAYKELFLTLEQPVREDGYYLLEAIQNTQARKVPSFTGEMPDGTTFDLASLEGKVILIDFWGSWCYWCREGHPHMKELYAKYKDKGFEIVGLGTEYGKSREEHWKKFKAAIAKDDISWPQILLDPAKRDLKGEFGVSYYPSKFLVDRDGRLVLKTDGDTEERLLDAKLKELFGY